MTASMAAGITSSLVLETVLLKRQEKFETWKQAAETAAGMSIISMLAMEGAENAVDLWATGGAPSLTTPEGLAAAGLAVCAGFITPMPYNYYNIKAPIAHP